MVMPLHEGNFMVWSCRNGNGYIYRIYSRLLGSFYHKPTFGWEQDIRHSSYFHTITAANKEIGRIIKRENKWAKG